MKDLKITDHSTDFSTNLHSQSPSIASKDISSLTRPETGCPLAQKFSQARKTALIRGAQMALDSLGSKKSSRPISEATCDKKSVHDKKTYVKAYGAFAELYSAAEKLGLSHIYEKPHLFRQNEYFIIDAPVAHVAADRARHQQKGFERFIPEGRPLYPSVNLKRPIDASIAKQLPRICQHDH